MIVALDEAKRRLVALGDVLAELKNQLRIDEAMERAQDLERETMVQDFWADAEKAKNLLGWEATHTVEDMCRSSWNFAKNASGN